MTRALHETAARVSTALACALVLAMPVAHGQSPAWNPMAYGMMPLVGPAPSGASYDLQAFAAPAQTARRGPLARLVRNPNASRGLPPYALADQNGRIQRYVEPMPEVDLESHVDRVVVVRHDTGRTLLASQLELPPLPMYPLLGDPQNGHLAIGARDAGASASARGDGIRQVQFADDDDATVQLLPDEEDLPDGEPASNDNIDSTQDVDGESAWRRRPPEESLSDAGTSSVPLDPAYGHGELIEPLPGMMDGCEGCPHCQGPHFPSENGPPFGHPPRFHFGRMPEPFCRWYADVELNFIRTHLSDFVFGKLSEKYELSPRVIVGFKDTALLDGRVRYWHYGQDTRVLGNSAVDVELDVLDVEATHPFGGKTAQFLLGGGLRLAGIDLRQIGAGAGADLIGMTFFIDGRTPLWSLADGRFSWTYGGRLSILGGDWGGSLGNGLVGGLIQDDNVIVHEMHTGLDYAFCYEEVDFHVRLGFEMQNWHSDALSQNAGVDSIGFIGPGIQIGAAF